MTSEVPPQNPSPDSFEQALDEVEQKLIALKTRYNQVQQAQEKQQTLQAEWEDSQLPEIQEQLQELEVTLESALLSERQLRRLLWEGLRQGFLGDPFWQMVRFGGLGVILGWLLKSCAG